MSECVIMGPKRPLTYESSSESSESDVGYSITIGSECKTCKPSTKRHVEGNRRRRRRGGGGMVIRREFSLSRYCLKRRLSLKWLEESTRTRMEEQWRELKLVESQFCLAQAKLRVVQAELDAKICELINQNQV